MTIVVNSLAREVPAGITVAQLLTREGEPEGHVLVEINNVYLPGREHQSRTLLEGDRVEIILPAFGG